MTVGTITVNPDSPERFLVEISEGEVLEIGRKPSADGKRKLVLPYPEVSGRHAEIRSKTTGWTVVDAGSTNGTVLNGLRLTPGKEYPLNSGDRIQIAQYELIASPPDALQQDHPANGTNDQEKTQFSINLINATILVGDIKGFTTLMESYAANPSVVMQSAQHIFETMNARIQSNYGLLEKVAGDAIMAYWQGDDSKSGASMQAFQACKTALELRDLCTRLAHDRRMWPFADHPLLIDIALATGPVAAGAIAHSGGNPNLLGDTANLVFRMEKLIKDDMAGDIIVEAQTYNLARQHFKFEPLGQHNVKGRLKPVDIYRLAGPA